MRAQIVLTAAAAFLGSHASAAVRELPAVADNSLFQDPNGALSNGQGPGIFVGLTNGLLIRRGLVRFDLTGVVPTGSTINTAEVRLSINRPFAAPYDASSLHRATASWGEGASNSGDPGGGGAPSQPGDATWIHRIFPDTLWSSPGGDFVSTSSATATPTALGSVTFGATAALRNDVQGWHDGLFANNGWLMKTPDEAVFSSGSRFASRENGTPADVPTLRIDFRAGGDATADDRVNISDFSILASNFNLPLSGPDNGDFNRSGTVEIGDFAILASNFNLDLNPPGRAVIPEPATWTGFVIAALVRRRRRYRLSGEAS